MNNPPTSVVEMFKNSYRFYCPNMYKFVLCTAFYSHFKKIGHLSTNRPALLTNICTPKIQTYNCCRLNNTAIWQISICLFLDLFFYIFRICFSQLHVDNHLKLLNTAPETKRSCVQLNMSVHISGGVWKLPLLWLAALPKSPDESSP